jgi:hypothetical protein
MCPDEWLTALGFDIYDKDARWPNQRIGIRRDASAHPERSAFLASRWLSTNDLLAQKRQGASADRSGVPVIALPLQRPPPADPETSKIVVAPADVLGRVGDASVPTCGEAAGRRRCHRCHSTEGV